MKNIRMIASLLLSLNLILTTSFIATGWADSYTLAPGTVSGNLRTNAPEVQTKMYDAGRKMLEAERSSVAEDIDKYIEGKGLTIRVSGTAEEATPDPDEKKMLPENRQSYEKSKTASEKDRQQQEVSTPDSSKTLSARTRPGFSARGFLSLLAFFMFEVQLIAQPIITQAPSPNNNWTLKISDASGTGVFNVQFTDQDLRTGVWSVAESNIPKDPSGTNSWSDNGSGTLIHPELTRMRFYRAILDTSDTNAPSADMSLGSQIGYTETRDLLVSVDAADDISGLRHVRFSTDDGDTWTDYIPFGEDTNVTHQVSLPATGYGPMQVKAEILDNAGNIRSAQDTVTLIPTNQNGYIDSNMDYFAPGNNTVEPYSGYPREGYTLTGYTQPTDIGFYAQMLANVISGDVATSQMSYSNAVSSLNTLVNSLLVDQANSSIGYKGLLPWLQFSGANRIRDTGTYGKQVMFGDNVNLSVALASSIGALSVPALDGDPTVQAIKTNIETFLEAQREGYEFLHNNNYGGWNFVTSTPVGSLPNYLGDEFRGGYMFATLRYGLPDSFYGNLNVHIRGYTLTNGTDIFTLAAWDGGAFQMLWPSFTPEASTPSMARILNNYVTIGLDFAAKNDLFGFPSAGYITPSTYSSDAGIKEIAYDPATSRNESAAPLYPLGPAYAINPSGIQDFFLASLRAHPEMVTNHGMWEGYYKTTGTAVQQQLSANVASLIVGLAGKGPEHLLAYYQQKGLSARMDTLYADGDNVDLISASTAAFTWGDAVGSKLGSSYTQTSAAFTSSGTAFIQNFVNISGGQLRIRYTSTTPVGNGQLELKDPSLAIKGLIKTIHFENTGGAEKEILIDLPPTPALSNIKEVVLVLSNGSGSALNFTITNLEILQGAAAQGAEAEAMDLRSEDGTFAPLPGKSPDDALYKVIARSEKLRNKPFTIKEYMEEYERVAATYDDIDPSISESTARNDIYGKGLKNMPSLVKQGVLAESSVRSETGAARYGLTDFGKNEIAQTEPVPISEYIAPKASDKGPGVLPDLTRQELRAVWETVERVRNSSIEIFLPQHVNLTMSMKKTLRDLRRKEGRDNVKCREYSDASHLGEMLGQDTEAGTKRIVVTENHMADEMAKLAKENPSRFEDIRLYSLFLPAGYDSMTKIEKTVCQAKIINMAILIRLFEKDKTPMVEMLLRAILRDRLEADVSVDDFIKNISGDGVKDTVRRIIWLLSKPVKLVEDLGKELSLIREFWISA